MITRRQFLKMGGAAALIPTLPIFPSLALPAGAAGLPELILCGPPAPLSMPLARLARDKEVEALVAGVEMRQWRNPDIMRTWVVSGEVQAAATPANAAAMLYNKGVPIRLMDVNNGGILSILTTDRSVEKFTDLKGKKLTLFYRGDIPDMIVRYLAVKQGIAPETDLTLSYVDSPFEAMQMFLSKKAETVLVPEPAATAALMKGKSMGLAINQIVIQEVWDQVTGRHHFLPLGGTLCQASLAEENPELTRAIQDGVGRAVDWINDDPAEAANEFAGLFGLKAVVLEQSLERFPIRRTPAAQAGEQLDFFFGALMELSPKLLGGSLPDRAFYLS